MALMMCASASGSPRRRRSTPAEAPDEGELSTYLNTLEAFRNHPLRALVSGRHGRALQSAGAVPGGGIPAIQLRGGVFAPTVGNLGIVGLGGLLGLFGLAGLWSNDYFSFGDGFFADPALDNLSEAELDALLDAELSALFAGERADKRSYVDQSAGADYYPLYVYKSGDEINSPREPVPSPQHRVMASQHTSGRRQPYGYQQAIRKPNRHSFDDRHHRKSEYIYQYIPSSTISERSSNSVIETRSEVHPRKEPKPERPNFNRLYKRRKSQSPHQRYSLPSTPTMEQPLKEYADEQYINERRSTAYDLSFRKRNNNSPEKTEDLIQVQDMSKHSGLYKNEKHTDEIPSGGYIISESYSFPSLERA